MNSRHAPALRAEQCDKTGIRPHLEHGLEAVRLGAEEVGLAAGVPRADQERVDIGTCRTAIMSWLWDSIGCRV